MIVWNEDFATGSTSIDSQHKTLILYINKLEEMLKNTRPTNQQIVFAHSLVDFLEQYAKTHFSFEEQCMECQRCPAHEVNRVQHAQFIEFFGRFHQKFRTEGFSVEAFTELHQTTSAWITSHILRIDTQLNSDMKP